MGKIADRIESKQQREHQNTRLAEMNRELQDTLEALRRAVPHTKDAAERERGNAMIRRLERELGHGEPQGNGKEGEKGTGTGTTLS